METLSILVIVMIVGIIVWYVSSISDDSRLKKIDQLIAGGNLKGAEALLKKYKISEESALPTTIRLWLKRQQLIITERRSVSEAIKVARQAFDLASRYPNKVDQINQDLMELLRNGRHVWKQECQRSYVGDTINPFMDFIALPKDSRIGIALARTRIETDLLRGLKEEELGHLPQAKKIYGEVIAASIDITAVATIVNIAKHRSRLLELRLIGSKGLANLIPSASIMSLPPDHWFELLKIVLNLKSMSALAITVKHHAFKEIPQEKLISTMYKSWLQAEWNKHAGLINRVLTTKDYNDPEGATEATESLQRIGGLLKLRRMHQLNEIDTFFAEKQIEIALDGPSPIEALRWMQSKQNQFPSNVTLRRLATLAVDCAPLIGRDENLARYATSLVLTAAHDSLLFIESLKETSWDDDYLWSVEGLLGTRVAVDTLDNLTLDSEGDGVHNVRDIQLELIKAYSSRLLSEVDDDRARRLRDGLETEKRALSLAYEVTGNKFRLAAPSLSRAYHQQAEIVTAIASKFSTDKNIAYLEALEAYAPANSEVQILKLYKEAQSWIATQVSVASGTARSYNKQQVNNYNYYAKEFPFLFDNFVASILKSLSTLNRLTGSQPLDINRLRYVADLIPSSVRIKKQIADMIANDTISRGNKKQLSSEACLALLIEALEFDATSHHTIENIGIVGSIVLGESITSVKTNIPKALEQLAKMSNPHLMVALESHCEEVVDFCITILNGFDREVRGQFLEAIEKERPASSGPFGYLQILSPPQSMLSPEGRLLVKKFALVERLAQINFR